MSRPEYVRKSSYRRDLFNALEECHGMLYSGFPAWLEAVEKLAEVRARKPDIKECRLSRAVDDYLKKASITK